MSDYPTGTVTFVFTDVVQSSRLWEQDHQAMDSAMAAHDEIMRDSIAANAGVLIKQTGDGVFGVFASAFDGVAAAMSIHRALADHSWGSAPALEVRLGVHTGEAELRGGDYFGSSVNRTARVMRLGEGGEVLLSLATEEVVRDRLPAGLVLRDLGERDLEGLSRPEHVFELAASDEDTKSAGSGASGSSESDQEARVRRAAWIAVLPFENMSGDPDQEYFADGITEDVIGGLAAWNTLRVMARTSSFHYKGSDASIDQIADELGVDYVLEGSVRRAGERVRVTAQLIEATGGHHVWADRYDADLVDIFDVQDQITRSIVVAIDPAILLAETAPELPIPPESLDAWDHVQLGRSETFKFNPEANAEAIGHFTAALEIDPSYSVARSSLAFAHFVDAWLNFVDTPSASMGLAYQEAKKAIELDQRDAMAHAILAYASFGMGRLDAMAASATRAIELNPSLAWGHIALGVAKVYGGEPDEGVQILNEGIALSPRDPGVVFFYGARAVGHLLAHRYAEAAADARTAIKHKYGYAFGRVLLTSALAHMDNLLEAQSELAELLEVNPDFTPALLDPYPFNEADRAHVIEGLYAAGLPHDHD